MSHCPFGSNTAKDNIWNDLLNLVTHCDFEDRIQANLEDEELSRFGTQLPSCVGLVVCRAAHAVASGVLLSHCWIISQTHVREVWWVCRLAC